MKKQKTMCFLGHGLQELGYGENTLHCDALKEQIKMFVISFIEQHAVFHFISGMEPGAEQFAAQIILDLKALYPQVTLECVLPCETQAENWNEWERDNYYRIVSECDTETMLERHASKENRKKRDAYIVDHSDYILAVWNGQPGSIARAAAYARAKQKPVLRLDPESLQISEAAYAVV